MKEFDLIKKYLKPLTRNHPASLLLSDDAAVISPKSDTQMVVSCDTIVENVHFLPNSSADIIAKKLIGCNLSDIAAMGAIPQFGLISATLPKNCPEEWLRDFCVTIERLNQKHDICLIGGDTTTHEGPLILSMTIIGQVERYRAVTRSGAHPGDNVYVSGNLGDAAIGLLVARDNKFDLERSKKIYFEEKYTSPDPRVELGVKLNGMVSAMIDISDGFIQDLGKIAESSNVAVEIFANKLPYSSNLQELMKNHDLVELALTGGDDYELLFTAPKAFHNHVLAISKETNIKITHIGELVEGNGVRILDKNNKPLIFQNTGYQHSLI